MAGMRVDCGKAAWLASGYARNTVPSSLYQLRETIHALAPNLMDGLIRLRLHYKNLYPEQLKARVKQAFKAAPQARSTRQRRLFYQ